MAVTNDILHLSIPQTLDPAERLAYDRWAAGEGGGIELLRDAPALFDYQHLSACVTYPHPLLETAFESGVAEPWISQLVCAFLAASGGRRVLETGSFLGVTASWLACTLAKGSGGELTACEIDPDRAVRSQERLESLHLPEKVKWKVVQTDTLDYLRSIPDESLDFAWVDDTHTHEHVDRELSLLIPKMAPGGIITGHDIDGSCGLRAEFEKYGGYAIELPRVGPAGGLGIIQLR